jgi:predicted Ser/Thr protein kinase
LPSIFSLGEPRGRPDQRLPDFARKSALADASGYGLAALSTQQPLAALGGSAAAVAHLNQVQDVDGVVRDEALLVNFDGHAVPSMSLMVAARSLNLGPQDMRLLPGAGLMLGRQRIPADETARVLPQFYPDQKQRPAFGVDAFYDVLSGRIPASKYADKIVIIGATAAGVGNLFATPVSPALSAAGMLAHTTSSILSGHFIEQPHWAGLAWVAAFLMVSVYLALVLPRLTASVGAATTAAFFALLLGGEYALLSGASIWLQMVFPATLLLLGHLALTTQRFLRTEVGKQRSDEESAETNRLMGLAHQGQGQLDMAFDRLRRVPHSAALMGNLQQLALDFERKRQFNKAQSVLEHMKRLDGGDAEVQAQLQRVGQLAQTGVLGAASAHPGGSLLLGAQGAEQPMLGRYRIDKELGKGAMGVVYLGRDPKIGRLVAIKTLALSSEFEGQDLKDVRERFFREAETAGRLQHPNIVTIFDAGEELDLAFIAMEFLKGQDLGQHTTPEQLLPVATVLRIARQVAQALDYAHSHNVVHRDIKPANIMFDPASETVKVTDFGIARITDASRTRTGMVMGTPSFMSPEQLSGQHVDGRSDLYALGVMLFQLLTGVLPLRAESMSALMYQIAHQAAPDVRSLRPGLPQALADILGRLLSKAPQDRFQTGADLATALDRLREALSPSDPLVLAPSAAAPGQTDAFRTTLVLTPRQGESDDVGRGSQDG